MTERYSKIEDETFPSFLGESVNSNISEALENCTFSSNLGLPVAASTIAKARNCFDRLPDAQASYLENEHLSLAGSRIRQSGGDPKGKYALSFKNDLEDMNAIIGTPYLPNNFPPRLTKTDLSDNASEGIVTERSRHSQDTLKSLAPGTKKDFSSDLCTLPRSKQKDKTTEVSHLYKDIRKETHDLLEDDSTSVASFLENEKLLSIASLDGSSSDDLDDEELYDDQLVAYFKKLLPPGMQRGVIEGQEIPEAKSISYTALGGVPRRPNNQDSEHLQFLEDYEEDFQMLHVRLAAAGMESAPGSDEEDVELELEKAAQQHLQRDQFLESTTRHLVGEQNRPSFRPGLEGGSSEDESSSVIQTGPNSAAELACRQSAEGRVLSSSGTSPATGDGCGLGDGSSGSDDNVKIVHIFSSNVQTTGSWEADLVMRNVAGEESENLLQLPSEKQIKDRIDPVGNGETTKEIKPNSSQLEKNMTCNTNLELNVQKAYEQSATLYKTDAQDSIYLSQMVSSDLGRDVHYDKYPMSEDMQVTDAHTSDGKVVNGLADAYLSPTHQWSQKECLDTSAKWQSDQEQPFQWSFDFTGNGQVGSPPHSVVYQNEEGKWVTDLAYYKSFDNEEGVRFSGTVNDLLNEEDFICGSDALAIIQEDQKEFEKENRFIQEEKMDLENISLNMGDTSWKLPTSNHVLLRASRVTTDLCHEDESYLRLSLGEFFGQRSEAMGCLGGGHDVKRPSFGYHIISPDKQEPVALLSTSQTSRGSSEHEDTIQFDNTLSPGDLEGFPDEQKLSSATFDVGITEKTANLDRNVHVPQMDLTHVEGQCAVKERSYTKKSGQRASESTLLSISTIASAIANASSSAEPSQLAAMIMALSNKNKNANLPLQASAFAEGSILHQMLCTSLEKCNAESAFDMERYLKITDVHGGEYETESFVDSMKNFTWDMSLSHKLVLQDSVGDLANITDIQKEADNSEEMAVNAVLRPLPVSDMAKPNAVGRGSSLGNASKAGDYRNLLTKSNTSMVNAEEMPDSKLAEYRTNEKPRVSDGKSSREKEKLYKSGTSFSAAAPRLKNSRTSESKGKLSLSHVPNSKQVQAESRSPETCNLPSNTQILKSPRRSSSRFANDSKFPPTTKETKKVCEDKKKFKEKGEVEISGNCQKHVGFELPSAEVSHKDTESKTFPDHDAHGREEEQYSFRPSTSPLIHSSPSQDSLTISDMGSGDCPQNTASVQRFAQVILSPEESCHSLSRLTYISDMDSTLQNTTIIPSPENNQSNNTIELSTTIVRASPTPSEIQIIKNKDNLSWQQNRCQMLSDSPNKLSKDLAGFGSAVPKSINNKSEESLKQQENKFEMEAPRLKCKETNNAVNSALSSDACTRNYLQALSVHVDPSFPWQEFTTKSSHGLCSLNGQPASGLGNYPLMQNICTNHQFVPLSGFKPVVSDSGSQILPSSLPTLLTGQPLSTTPFAQQYLGSVPSVGSTAVPLYRVGSSAVYGPHTGYPSSTIQAQHMQNSVTGIPLSTNAGSRLLATLPISNQHHSGNHNILNPASGYPGQSVSTTGLPHWGGRMSSGFEQALVPEELTFPSACCVGIASQASLSIFNPNERWLQVNIGILSVAVNGEKVDAAVYQCLVFKNKTIIGPRAAEDLKIIFLPQRSGLFQCVLCVSSWPVSADTETVVRSEAVAAKVVITAVSENPFIEVESGKADCLDFGDLTSGSWKTLPLKIINKTHATVPVRLIISASAAAWRCFTFCKDPANLATEHLYADTVYQMSSPSVISHVMHASYDGQDPEFLVVWVVFHAPKMLTSTGALGPAEEFLARVDVEVDSPGPACMLKSVPLCARAGSARIHAPKDLQTIHLFCKVGSSAKQLLPLKNAGNIAVYLKIKSSNAESSFTVDLEDLFLVPGEEQAVVIKFSPQDCKTKKESVLKIMVQPSGPQYEVMLVGETEMPGNRNSMNTQSFDSADVPPILSNKQFIAWGGVTLGRTVQQKLILRNTSTSASQHLRLLIRGQDQDCFQLQNTFGPEERLTNNRELTIRPKEDASIHLMFSPTRVGCMLAKLDIKQSGVKSSQPGIKFTIPLTGYGGTSNIILEDVKKLSDSYMVILNGISSDRVSKVSFYMRNTGSRAAYLKAVCFADFQTKITMDQNVLRVTPEKFILKERSQEMITIFCNSTKRERNLCKTSTALICTVCFFCGDEVARQQYRRALLHKPDTAQKIFAENALLKNIRFDEEFPGEQLVSEVYDLPQRPNDVQLFYGNMHKVILSVVGSDTNASGDSFQPSLRPGFDRAMGNAVRNIENTSLDVLPVKGPQGPPLALSAGEPARVSANSEPTWSVQPECLMLPAPSISGIAGTGHVNIVNTSTKPLQFELSWPAHCLTITPQHGNIEPQSHIIILVSPNPSLATKQTLLPWSGHIYVHCDNGQKFIKVQIREDVTLDMSATGATPQQLANLLPHSETPIHVAKPLHKPPSTKVEMKNRTLVFPKTASGESSETFLDIENPGDEDVKWLLSSFAPPYVKGVDLSGDVYRATYTAFRCSRVSGLLAAHDKLKVPITFFPRDRGDYAQFWDLECHPISEPHLKHKLRFQLSGEGIKDENVLERSSADSLIKTEVPVKPRRRSGSEASALKALNDETVRGVYASEELYTFSPTPVGDSSTLKVNLQNNSFTTHMSSSLYQPASEIQTKFSRQIRWPAGRSDRHRKYLYSTCW
ncbi:hypothetical protein FKM82_006296 [Ascaphus truei]